TSGIPSIAAIVELRDYTHIFAMSTPTVLTGTAHATMTKEQTFLGDNSYLGGYITSDGGGLAEVQFEGTASGDTSLVIQGKAEIHVSTSAFYEMWFWNWDDSAWQQGGCTGWTDTNDWPLVSPRFDYTTMDADPYI